MWKTKCNEWVVNYIVSYFVLGKVTMTDDPSFISEKNINYETNEPKMSSIAIIDDSELPIRYRRAIILREEIMYIEVQFVYNCYN